jgi:hypothetical protein
MPVELLSAMAYDLETFETQGYPDPVLKVPGELPARARPFGINRVYQGAQGMYEESILVLDADDVVVWQSPWRYVELRGEMYEDLFRTRVGAGEVEVTSAGEHQLVFLIDGSEIGRIPLFIDAGQSARAMGVSVDAAEAALKKGSIVWVSIPQPDGSVATRPAWYVQQGRRLFLVKGGIEQELPNLERNDRVEVVVKSKDVKAAIATLAADVRVVPNDSDEFETIATQGLGTRLNLKDGDGALQRWKDECTMVELTLQD